MEYDIMLAVLRKINATRDPEDNYIHLELYVDGSWCLIDARGVICNGGENMNELLQCLTVLKGEK